MIRRAITFFALISAFSGVIRAQWDVQFSDFTALKSYYNPAVSGTDGLLNVAAAYSMQMVGYENAPQTMFVGADCPIYFMSPRHGAGLNLFSDQAGIFNTMRLSLQYAYNMKLGQKGRLAVGLQGGLLTEKIDPKNLDLETSNDPAFPSSAVNTETVDLGAGVYFYHPLMWAGLSALHLLGPTLVLNEKYEVHVPQSFYFMAGGNIKLKNTLLTLQPAFMLMTDLKSWREDIQCKAIYEYETKKMYIGLGYSPKVSTTFMVGGMFHGIKLGYSYQLYTSGISAINGSHEVVLGYQTDLDLFKKGRNAHKSVRWL